MNNFIHFPSFIIAILVASGIAFAVSYFTGLSFVICLLIVIAAIFLNGIIIAFTEGKNN